MSKKSFFYNAQFITAAACVSDFPHINNPQKLPLKEVAIVGKSNVGKSSLINYLLNNYTIAKTSSKPGKTQTINFFTVDQQFLLVDLPGYGYARVDKKTKEKWSELIDLYLKTRSSLRLILFLVDIRRSFTEDDLSFIKWAHFYHKNLLIIFTKSDKLKIQEIKKQIHAASKTLSSVFPMQSFEFFTCSIKEPQNRIILTEKIKSLLQEKS
ncbi:putative GTP-binding protein EngB [Candidatus Rhabdochlamydia oedothoracis]|uniref:Probable GTP-binding protein EngB n=1 Tax=Candidatus Rhabdochlamydia oedothoracis TaxID=2720720 RepID=A0ABX8V2G2_9BACT|nr:MULTISPECIES: ribosome biogenesis GTP-binding protein YihA/YsxC [Rhabdochlamydia]KAG6559704.1 putative GTP-binding protein EngB [Candidatus Rhabdochlamydia sp. W815]MCL6756359.1 ribosome biogenesis GTP-binding protein YihA/YsxC [Candidatus Rhabdochlamydia oedothoracis]QYF49442.1 putative GTP-binding protein EngB [Candidatus Rhabdochlamydia oedothoracis]